MQCVRHSEACLGVPCVHPIACPSLLLGGVIGSKILWQIIFMSPVIQGRLFRELVSLDGIETKRHYCKFLNMFVKLGPVFFDFVLLMVWKEFSAKGVSRARRHQSGFLVPICGTCYGSLIRWVYEDAFIIFEIMRWLETFTWGWIASGIYLIDQLG